MIFKLMYFSMAAEGIRNSAVEAIVATAHKNNPTYGITGFLTFNDSEFLQYIEGGESEVRQLVQQIEHDRRNEMVLILHTRATEERTFPAWSMQWLSEAPQRRSDASPNDLQRDIREAFAALDSGFQHAYLYYLKNFPHGHSDLAANNAQKRS